MRFSRPQPGNPWRHDMVIRVDHPHHVHVLLFIREAWSLAADADIPALDPRPDWGTSRLPNSAGAEEWERRWRAAWKRAWDWYQIADPDPSRLQELTPEAFRSLSAPGRDLNPLVPPFWQAEYDSEGLDFGAFGNWEWELIPRIPSEAERESLPELIRAWKSGIDNILVLPYEGWFARRISHRYLAVSPAVRDNPENYSRSLAAAADE
ncbi:MAG: hypothetical protein M3017_04525 [Actinomycetota bacterium]|nr:hypothetical protein [Actinomycetota bacterium]